jgi:hypothetical protein
LKLAKKNQKLNRNRMYIRGELICCPPLNQDE